ncbi:MAG TPA: preprotein translocase subunit SecA [Candidatus Paceibacterota bacterium]|nr:preprotein translocase subunit SecA [Candidatus Paceibacterota bacterium]
MALFSRLMGTDEQAALLRKTEPLVAAINAREEEFRAFTDADLAGISARFRERLAAGETLDDLLPEAFAAVREAAQRTLGLRHFDVQLVGGIIMHWGNIAEMRTGEGKTLVATLPVYLNALAGKGVHVVTVNDYLSRRDAAWMGQVYDALGLTVGVLNHEVSFLYDAETATPEDDQERDELGSFKVEHDFLRTCERREAYAADITYGTNNEYGFDYLRDSLEYDPAMLRQRAHAYAIVDEIDSILIDEARTPLIISAPVAEAEALYQQFVPIAKSLTRGEDYEVDEKRKQIEISDSGIEKAERALNLENIYTDKGIKYVHHLEKAVQAEALYERDRDYVVRDGEVVIVDEFTGRLQPGRRWSEGLHQAIEAKEGVPIQRESRTMASITFQNFFRLYDKLAGMTGTAVTSNEEFYKVYGLTTVAIPTNKPIARIDHDDLIFQTEKGKFQAISAKVKQLHEKGQPVLVGTVSVEKNELLSAHFRQAGIPHEILNAKNHEREGEIVAQAGAPGAVTIATNMAGRGVDIKLGGNPGSPEAEREVRENGGLFVLGTERHEARRIDNQLRGRAGRQGDPGETQFFVSLEDPLMRVFAADTIKSLMGTFRIPEDEPIQNRIITRSLEKAQTKIEEFHFDGRKQVLAYDDVLNVQRQTIYARRRELLLGSNEAIDQELLRIADGDEEAHAAFAKKKQELGEVAYYAIVRRLMLQTIDMLWVDQLETMDYLRNSVSLRAYGQRDPLVEYKKEGLRLFQELEASYAEDVVRLITQLASVQPAAQQAPVEQAQLSEVHAAALELTKEGQGSQAAAHAKKHDRNDRVTITNGSESQTVKYKKAELMLAQGWRIVE